MRSRRRKWLAIAGVAACLGGGLAPARAADEAVPSPARFEGLRLRSIGPALGGRVSRVAGIPGDPLTYFAATAQGGVWKSSNGGRDWRPVFDDQPVASIGSIAVAPSDPNVVWVGSGEANIRGNVVSGRGIFRSTDGGESWTRVWNQVGQIGAMAVDPRDPDVAFAAVLGHAFGPNPERGVYKTADGGATWRRVLYVDEDTGASDVAIDPSNPRNVFAGTWAARRSPWDLTSGGPGGGLWRSTDGGETWTRLGEGEGLPAGIWGKVGAAVAPSDPRRIYALVEAEDGGLYRSDDGGASWTLANEHRALRQRAWYYSTLTVDPTDADVVWFPQVPLLRTIDGGRTIHRVSGTSHGDHHDLWIDPEDTGRMIVAHDGGVDLTLDGGETWSAPRLPIAQFYNVDASTADPFWVGGTMQDLGTAAAPIDPLEFGGLAPTDWIWAGGGEAGDFRFDPNDPQIAYAGEYGGKLTVVDLRTGAERNVSAWPFNPSGHAAAALRLRFQWTAPIALSPHRPDELLHGANVLLRSRDRGRSWEAISPDLTRDDTTKQQWAGGPITGDNTGVEVYDTIFSIDYSKTAAGTIWVGSDDGLVHVTPDDGATWKDVTPRGMPAWGTVDSIETSHRADGTAWVAVEARRLDDPRPHLFRTTDGGATWRDLSNGLPPDQPLHVVREDPARPGLLFAGTELGLHVSFDGGERWEAFDGGLPPAKVTDLVVRDRTLIVATTGRGLWVLDDLTPLRALTPEVEGRPIVLFDPPPATRRQLRYRWGKEDEAKASPSGARLVYRLAEAVEGELRLEIRDASGRLVRTLSSVAEEARFPEDDPDEPEAEPEAELSGDAGFHVATWDLTWEGLEPLEDAKIDLGGYASGPAVAPGRYTARLIAGARTAETTLELRADPRSGIPVEELVAQQEAALATLAEIGELAEEVRLVRSLREQADALAEHVAGREGGDAIAEVARRITERCDDLERRLHNPDAEVTYDILARPGGAKLLSQLVFLYESERWGDGAPTQGMREVRELLDAEHRAIRDDLAALRATELAELERLAREAELPRILLGP